MAINDMAETDEWIMYGSRDAYAEFLQCEIEAENARAFTRFIQRLGIKIDAIRVIVATKATNALYLFTGGLKLPVWRCGRWKSVT